MENYVPAFCTPCSQWLHYSWVVRRQAGRVDSMTRQTSPRSLLITARTGQTMLDTLLHSNYKCPLSTLFECYQISRRIGLALAREKDPKRVRVSPFRFQIIHSSFYAQTYAHVDLVIQAARDLQLQSSHLPKSQSRDLRWSCFWADTICRCFVLDDSFANSNFDMDISDITQPYSNLMTKGVDNAFPVSLEFRPTPGQEALYKALGLW